MNELDTIIEGVADERLNKDQLMNYQTALANLSARYSTRMAELEKEEARFLNQSEEATVAGAKRKWDATPQGQEQIEKKHGLRAIDKLYSSTKSRLYSIY